MATVTDTITDTNGNVIIDVSSSVDDAITLATAGTYSDKNIIFNITMSEELTNAVNTALAQAKASGEFDGADGMHILSGDFESTGIDNNISIDNFGISATDIKVGDMMLVKSVRKTTLIAVGDIVRIDSILSINSSTSIEATVTVLTNITGPQGPKGDIGEIGPQGPKGDTGADGKSAYQYAVEGGYTGTEEEFAEKLAQEQLTGTTDELTPTQVYEAVSAGIPIKVQYTSNIYGVMSFTAFNIAETAGVIVSQSIVMVNGVYVLAGLGGYIQSGQWFFNSTVLAEKEDIPTVPSSLPNPNALTFTGAVTGSYDGSAAKTVNIPSTVTDDHINELINAALNAIGVAEGVSY